jgi:putative transposase
MLLPPTGAKHVLNNAMKFKTLKHYDLPGHAHELTFSCHNKQNFLAHDEICKQVIEAMENTRQLHSIHIWAYVIMPNHVHLLIFPLKNEYQIGKILWALKVPVSRWENSQRAENSPSRRSTTQSFWERGGGYDRNLTTPDIIRASIDYIHNNPVRKRLVETPTDWNWSSAGFYAGSATYPIRMDFETLPFSM